MKYWTTKEHAIAALPDAGLIAIATGRTIRSVQSYRYRNRLTSINSFTAEDDAYIVMAREQGHTWHEIAMRLGRTAGSCQSRAVKLRARKCQNA